MAAMLGRPVVVVGGADGTARGAAALGLFALGRAPTLGEAAAQLAGPASPPSGVDVDAALVATYDRLRASVADLIDRLDPVATLFSRSGDDGRA
jgi:gluconokinase